MHSPRGLMDPQLVIRRHHLDTSLSAPNSLICMMWNAGAALTMTSIANT